MPVKLGGGGRVGGAKLDDSICAVWSKKETNIKLYAVLQENKTHLFNMYALIQVLHCVYFLYNTSNMYKKVINIFYLELSLIYLNLTLQKKREP